MECESPSRGRVWLATQRGQPVLPGRGREKDKLNRNSDRKHKIENEEERERERVKKKTKSFPVGVASGWRHSGVNPWPRRE